MITGGGGGGDPVRGAVEGDGVELPGRGRHVEVVRERCDRGVAGAGAPKDVAGGIYAGVLHAAAPVPPSHDLTDERLDVFRLAPDGAQVSHVSVPHPPSGLESFRELEIADVGVVWWMHALPDGSGVAVDELAL